MEVGRWIEGLSGEVVGNVRCCVGKTAILKVHAVHHVGTSARREVIDPTVPLFQGVRDLDSPEHLSWKHLSDLRMRYPDDYMRR